MSVIYGSRFFFLLLLNLLLFDCVWFRVDYKTISSFLSSSNSNSIVGMTPNLNVNVPGASPTSAQTTLFGGGAPNANTLGALVSQHRLLELSRFGLRGYDLAQHMLTQQGAVSKLLGEFKYLLRTLINVPYNFTLN